MHDQQTIRRGSAIAIASALALGCSAPASNHRSVCAPGFVGELSQVPEVQMVISDGKADAPIKLNDRDLVPLVEPEQGGYVIYAGVEAHNLDPCGVVMLSSLRDRTTGEVLSFDGRTVTLEVGVDGWARPTPGNLSTVANINACPSYGANDVVGQVYDLEIKLTDREQRSVSTVLQVVPSCMQSDAGQQSHCVCTCSANYSLGKCNFDGGAGK